MLGRSQRILLCPTTLVPCPLLSSALRISTSHSTHSSWNRRGYTGKLREYSAKLREYSAARLVDDAPKSMQPYLRLIRFDKPIGTWLLYWPGAWSITLAAPAGSLPNLTYLALFGAGAVCMRGAGCIINDLWDKDFDRKVERTRSRPLASGVLSDRQAIAMLAGLLSTSLAILLQFNWLTVAIGASSLLLVGSYPLAKRFTYWPQAVLGLTFNYGAIMGYTAAAGHFSFAHIVPLYAAGICWTLIYDTIYAHQDKADDSLIGVKSTALRFGDQTKLWLSGFAVGMLGNLYLLGELTSQPLPYYLGLTAVGAHLAWQITTVDINNGRDCWEKFTANRWIGPILLASIVLANLLRRKDEKAGGKSTNK